MEFYECMKKLSRPARSALEEEGIDSFEILASLRKEELLSLHGIGPHSLPVVIECLKTVGLKLRE